MYFYCENWHAILQHDKPNKIKIIIPKLCIRTMIRASNDSHPHSHKTLHQPFICARTHLQWQTRRRWSGDSCLVEWLAWRCQGNTASALPARRCCEHNATCQYCCFSVEARWSVVNPRHESVCSTILMANHISAFLCPNCQRQLRCHSQIVMKAPAGRWRHGIALSDSARRAAQTSLESVQFLNLSFPSGFVHFKQSILKQVQLNSDSLHCSYQNCINCHIV